jgi:hypothetical protein
VERNYPHKRNSKSSYSKGAHSTLMESTRKRIAETYNKPLVALLSKTKTKRKRTKKTMMAKRMQKKP